MPLFSANNRGNIQKSLFRQDFSQYLQLCPGIPSNFMICGKGDCYTPLYELFADLVGKLPIIAVHASDISLCNTLEAAVINKTRETGSRITPQYFDCRPNHSAYEPFWGMSQEAILRSFESMAKKMGFSPSAEFFKVVQAHLHIIDILEQESNTSGNYSLSDLFYLCSFVDLEAFHENINCLDCSQTDKLRIWADLQTATDPSLLSLFRVIVNRFSNEATATGWKPDSRRIGNISLSKAISQKCILSIQINPAEATVILTYLAHELNQLGKAPFFLLLHGIPFLDDEMIRFLISENNNCCFGIVCESLYQISIGCDNEHRIEALSNNLIEKIQKFIVFRHRTAQAAESVSKLIGEHDVAKETRTHSSGQLFWSILPQHRGNATSITDEKQWRIKPYEIQELKQNQAFLFDADNNSLLQIQL